MKDVAGCDKPRGAPKQALIRGFPNGETQRSKTALRAVLLRILNLKFQILNYGVKKNYYFFHNIFRLVFF